MAAATCQGDEGLKRLPAFPALQKYVLGAGATLERRWQLQLPAPACSTGHRKSHRALSHMQSTKIAPLAGYLPHSTGADSVGAPLGHPRGAWRNGAFSY